MTSQPLAKRFILNFFRQSFLSRDAYDRALGRDVINDLSSLRHTDNLPPSGRGHSTSCGGVIEQVARSTMRYQESDLHLGLYSSLTSANNLNLPTLLTLFYFSTLLSTFF